MASDIAKVYEKNRKVEAVLLGGSVARNWNDQYSDIELFVFWKDSPTDEDRLASIEKVEGDIIDFHTYEDEEWSETYITQGIKLEISNFLTDTINQVIDDVLLSFDTNLDKQCLVAAVHYGVSLSGDLVINPMKKRTHHYPTELSLAMIKDNILLGNRWNNRLALLDREDWLMLYKVMVDVQTNIMGMLFGLNRLYVHHPAFKWQKQTLESMEMTPTNTVHRLGSTFLEDPSDSIKNLERIIREVYELIQMEHPQIDLSSVIDKSLFLRPKN
ncbi:cytoplasmic protein [Salipaludibacillus keqinensis]|uniref:Cytoplasmic protein n=1 Tax=Salipaludibacillus keqinensis TaxID=2045207 RepID=A0A323TFQ8_9BACI|nr:DUF4037 domain-containing protein [Salipaludibacillus keqinensis]PYZ93350.1 cytoplasmic protein [Salipaludibacillus keqinensis]